jgi:hypothetical protein
MREEAQIWRLVLRVSKVRIKNDAYCSNVCHVFRKRYMRRIARVLIVRLPGEFRGCGRLTGKPETAPLIFCRPVRHRRILRLH